MITWPDNNPGLVLCRHAGGLTNSHDYTWVTVSGDKVEKWTEKLEQRDWAALEHAWSTAHLPRRRGDRARTLAEFDSQRREASFSLMAFDGRRRIGTFCGQRSQAGIPEA